MDKPSAFERFNNWLRRSVTIKLFSIGILILILLIPTSMLTGLIYERQQLHDGAIEEISSKWGRDQTIGGPVLTIPYWAEMKTEKGVTEYTKRYAHFLPDQLDVNGKIFPEQRYRGIYVVVLYKTLLTLNGSFSYPDVRTVGLDPARCLFNEAFMSVGLTDLKGINEGVECKLNDSTVIFGPGVPTHDIVSSGMSGKVNLSENKEMKFSMTINLNGSSSLSFLPFGKETKVSISSPWANPSFDGAFLPDTHDVKENGFTSQWKVLQLNRNYPQQGLGNFISDGNDNSDSRFGVRLLLPVDEYQKNVRSVKYCIMFIILTFLTFFFFEVLNKKRIHPIQYLLVGFAICLFYVLLLSISEHLNFSTAYLIGSISTVALVTFYVKSIFQSKKLTALFAVLLSVLYGFFYSLLQLQDYSLLLGSLGLFFILAVIMTLTRKVNWYGED
ncbi:MAG: cell envelope integrity protein CreD [Bacteroidetes bacterium]|nr:cell envelope integrity protein CreD [Bacteroidota bacterium]